MIDQGKDIKRANKRNWTNREYPVQDNKEVTHKSVKISCATTQFHALPFCGPHIKQHEVKGIIKHYHLRLVP